MTSLLLLSLAASIVQAADLRYLGLTTDSFFGNDGLAAMNAACEADYDTARVCTDGDIAELFRAPTPTESAWVLFLPVAAASAQDSEYRWVGRSGVVYRGYYYYHAPNCTYASTAAYAAPSAPFNSNNTELQGLVLDTDGGFTAVACNTARPAACCGPVR